MHIRKALKNGSGTMKSLGEALEYAVKTKPDIVHEPGPEELSLYIKNQQLHKLNIPVVCAAGNVEMLELIFQLNMKKQYL